MFESFLKVQLLDIVSLSSSEPRSGFSKQEIDDLAKNFIQVGGNVKPLLVKRLDFESFQVVDGHLEYYAAVRAQEINDDFEMIGAIILTTENEQKIRQQFSHNQDPNIPVAPPIVDGDTNTAIAQLERNLLAHVQDRLGVEVSKLEANLSKNLETKFDGVRILVPNDQDHLDFFNHADIKKLIDKLGSAGFIGKRGEKIAAAITKEREVNIFSSFADIVERVRLGNKNRAITEASMVKILDAWNRFIDIK